jgi:hypothetical protein
MEMLNGNTSTSLLSYVNGTALDAKNGSTSQTTGVILGWNNSNQFWNGLVGEILIYNSVLTTKQRQVVEGYLAWKWNLQAQLPAGHPFLNRPPVYNESTT